MPNPLQFLIDYRLTATSLQVFTIGGLVLREVPFSEMREVKRGFEAWNEHWRNRLDFLGPSMSESAVSIRLDRPVLPWFVITPEQPAQFVAELRKHLAQGARA